MVPLEICTLIHYLHTTKILLIIRIFRLGMVYSNFISFCRAMAQTVHLVPLQVAHHRPLRQVTRPSQWDLNLGHPAQEVLQIPTHTLDKGRQCIQECLDPTRQLASLIHQVVNYFHE